MRQRPLGYEARRPPWKPTAKDSQSLDLDDHAMAGVVRVKVRRQMIVVVHADGDSEEPADLGHEPLRGDNAAGANARKPIMERHRDDAGDQSSWLAP